MSKYSAYPVYKDSGVEWLGEVPEHWEVRRLKFTVSHNDETLPENTPEDEILEYVDISSVNLVEGITKTEQLSFEKAPSRARRLVKNGDTIISTVRTYLKAIAFIENAPDNLVVSTGFAVIRPSNNVNAKFFAYFFQGQFFIDKVVANSIGVSYPAINASDLVCIPVSYPEQKEQQQIAAFLDNKTAHLDTLIEKKQQMIGLLNEKRIALITQAVTKGLDLSVPMKDSGVEWLGNVPEHWDTVSLRWISKRYSGGTPDKSNDDYWYEGTIPWLNSGAVNQQVITEPSTHITEEAFKNSSAKWIPENSVLIALAGQGKTKGMAAYTTFPTTCNQSMAAIIFEKYNSKFMFWWLTSQYKNIRGLASDDGRDGLNLEMLGSIPCPIFDEKEQQQIANFLDRETAKIDRMINTIQSAIAKLQEYRTALITAAVTGKIDVRTLTPYEG